MSPSRRAGAADRRTTMSDSQNPSNVAVWFEIPARDFARAVTFYETLFATALRQESFGGPKMAVFPYQRPGVSGMAEA